MVRRTRKPWKRLRRRLTYQLVFAPILWGLRHAPRFLVVATLRGFLEPIAHLATRRTSQANLLKVYGDAMDLKERRRVARAVTHNFVSGLLEVRDALVEGKGWLEARLDGEAGLEVARQIKERYGPGAVAVTGHIGNWELIGGYMSQFSEVSVGAVIAHRMPNEHLNAAVERIRTDLGMVTKYRDDPPGDLIRILRKGQWIATVPDQDVKRLAGVFIDFLGHSAYTPTGPARLALVAGAPMVVGYMIRQPNGRFRFEFGEPIEPDRGAPREQEIERLTRAWSAEVEALIRRYPEQWAWFHPRWRTRPEDLDARGRGKGTAGESDS